MGKKLSASALDVMINELRALVVQGYEALADLEAQRRELTEKYPPEPEAGTMLRFALSFNGGNGRLYDFAALRAGERWYTTGATCPTGGYSWRGFIDWLRSDEIGSLSLVRYAALTSRVVEVSPRKPEA